MNRLFFLLIIIFFNVASSIAQVTIQGSFVHDGIQRTYRLYIPATYNPAVATPLLMNLHGYGSNNVQQELYGNFKPVADTAGFLLVHPNGTLDNTNTMHWNNFGTSNVDDVGFLSALIDTIAHDYNVNMNRVYSTGMSNGGFMSYALACGLSNRIAAIASVTGSMVTTSFGLCTPQHPFPVMQIHGTADLTVPYNGNTYFVPIETLINYWIDFNNCNTNAVVTQVPDVNTNDGCTATHYFYGGGDNGSTVELYKINGGGHSWPGALINLNVTNMDFSASAVVWQFLRKYSLDNLISGSEVRIQKTVLVNAFPNPSNGSINLRFENSDHKIIRVYNAIGSEIDVYTCDSDQYTVPLSDNGLYLFSIEYKGVKQTLKVMNQK